MKKLHNRGFTLAELLIVVAIIAVLVAIAIPIFTSQLEKSREATDAANIRDAYAEIAVGLLDGSLEKANDSMTVTGGYTATLKADASATFTVEVASFKIHQIDYTSWVGGAPEIAGYSCTAIPTAATNTVTFKFTVPTTGNTYLSDITFS